MKHLLLLLLYFLPLSAYPQLIESFSESDITASYPWEGMLERFKVNEAGELQLNALEGNSKAHFFIASTRLFDNEWLCKVGSGHQGTSRNYINIYLWCRQPDMENPGEAVFVRLGYTNKSVALCYQLGNLKPRVLIEGRVLFGAASEVAIRVTTDANGVCSVYSKAFSDADYHNEGSVQLPIADASGHFMIGMSYSATHSRDKYVDDIYIKRYIPVGEDEGEKKVPKIIQMGQTNETTLLVWFDQPVSAENASFVLSSIGEVAEVAVTDNGMVLQLIWDTPMIKGVNYRLTYTDLCDKAGSFHTGTYSFTATFDNEEDPEKDDPPAPDTYGQGDILIWEVMADPKGITALPKTEYVELFNTTTKNIPLRGWSFYYGNQATVLADLILPANGYVVLYREGRDIRIDQDGIGMPLAKFPSQLANAGKALWLADASGNMIDQTEYGQARPGVSWERSNKGWYLSTNNRGGTPGSVNSSPDIEPEPKPEPEVSPVEPQEIVFNELLPDPFTGGSEYIELYNRSEKELPIDGLSIAVRKMDGSLSTHYPLQSLDDVLEPEGYVVVTREKEGVTSFYTVSSATRIREVKMPVLANTSSTLVLFRTTDGMVVDEMSYIAQWHDPKVKDRKGVALERIDPDKPTQEASNWTSATTTAGYGTPGSRNSQYKATDPDHPTGIEAPVYDPRTGEYTIPYAFDGSEHSLNIRVYDLSGRQVAVIANNEPVGMSGRLTWNGTGSNGSRLMPGVYIVYIEACHPGGQVKKGKKVFLVH